MMKITFKALLILVGLVIANLGYSQIDLSKKIPGIKYEKEYTFSKCVNMELDFYNKKGRLRMTIPYWGYYNDNMKHFNIKHQRGNTVYHTLFDMPNNNCLILLGEGDQMMGSASVMKDNEGRVLKELPLKKTTEKKEILGYRCLKYTFEVDNFHGELWACPDIEKSNNVGVLKASKMGKYYQKVNVDGFVMEITSITPRGKKTVMRTTGFDEDTNYKVSIPDDFGTAINKIDFYAY